MNPHFEVLSRFTEATELRLLLETGRTHQIRVHMSYIGYPVIGDPIYAGNRKKYGLQGQVLHSESVSFIHPNTGEELSFSCDIPDYYKELLTTFTPLIK